MHKPAEIEWCDHMLATIARQGLSLATDLHDRALAAETAADAARLSAAWHRMARSLRQTVALKAKLDRDRIRAARQDRKHARREAARPVASRKEQLRAALERRIWTEYETAEAEQLADELDLRLDEEAFGDGFVSEPVVAQIQRLAEALGLPLPAPHHEGGDRSGAADRQPPLAASAWAPSGAGVSADPAERSPAACDHPFQNSA